MRKAALTASLWGAQGVRKCTHVLVAGCLVLVSSIACAEVYRVGPGEEYPKISDVAQRLHAGDVIEVTGDITDHFTLTANGTYDNPITIRGVTRIEDGVIVRPRIKAATAGRTIARCEGDRTILEGLEFTGIIARLNEKVLAIKHDCDHLTIRNCAFRSLNWKALVGSPTAGSVNIGFCEFDSVGNVATNGKVVDVWSWKPGSIMTVEHCWFHDSTGGVFLKSHCPRNVIRYNWFENCHFQAVKVVDRMENFVPPGADRPEGMYPMHTDIVGNVFFQGWSPWDRYSILSLGGAAPTEAGTEGDFHIAHNLFVMTKADKAVRGAHMLVHGNVDRIRAYNNIFMELGGPGCAIYERGEVWEVPATTAFRERRGHGEPIVEGANNWVSARTVGIPEGLVNTLRGINPHFMDLVNFDFQPAKDSPLAGAGLWPLPRGRIVELAPEFEPQRGIPIDLKPTPRRKATPPSIGPFEAVE